MGKRMYYILKIIYESQGNSITAQEILDQLKDYDIYIDIKTVYSCVKQINAFFYEWIGGNLITSLKKTGLFVKNEFFSDGELQFLLDSILFHQDLNNEDKSLLKNKLLSLSSFHQQKRLVEFIPTQKELMFSLFVNLTTIMKAIENKTVLSFQYINYDIKYSRLKEFPSQNGNNKEQYIVSPYQIVSQNNHYYLIGYNDKHKNQLTTYRVDRMRYIQTYHQPFIEIREQFDMTDEIEKMTNMYISHHRDTLEIECDKKILREIVSRFGTNLKAKKLYQDHYLLTIEDIPISEGLMGWIMMMQDQIKVISPLYLKQDVQNKLERMIRMYKEET